MNDNAPPEYRGLDRFAARKKHRRDRFETAGPAARRSRRPATRCPTATAPASVVEPYLTDQWYVDAKTLAQPAIKRGGEGRLTVFVPELGEDLLRVDAQHPSPGASRASSGGATASRPGSARTARIFVGETELTRPAPSAPREEHYGRDDSAAPGRGRARHLVLLGAVAVLDAGLAAIDTPDLQRFYPTHTLVTGFDIIFFWVARMMMHGPALSWTTCPFKRVFINALVRDARAPRCRSPRATSSTRWAWSITYGADALRFTLTAMSGQAQRHQALHPADRGLSKLRHQAVERHALLPDERLRRVEGFDPATATADRQPLDSRRDGHPHIGPQVTETPLRTAPSTTRPAPSTASSGTRQYCDWYPGAGQADPGRNRPTTWPPRPRPGPWPPGCWRPS